MQKRKGKMTMSDENKNIDKSIISNVNNKPQGRRVGTITTGIALITTGVAMFLSIIYPSLKYISLFKFAPLLLCLLGIEILIGFGLCKNNSLKYDYAGIFLAALTVICAISLSGSYVYYMIETAM